MLRERIPAKDLPGLQETAEDLQRLRSTAKIDAVDAIDASLDLFDLMTASYEGANPAARAKARFDALNGFRIAHGLSPLE
jgi:hypothetical protein